MVETWNEQQDRLRGMSRDNGETWDLSEHDQAAITAALARIAELERQLAEARKDSARLRWMCTHDVLMAHSKDGETCHLFWPVGLDDADCGDPYHQPGRFLDPYAAIDAAMEANNV